VKFNLKLTTFSRVAEPPGHRLLENIEWNLAWGLCYFQGGQSLPPLSQGQAGRCKLLVVLLGSWRWRGRIRSDLCPVSVCGFFQAVRTALH